MIIVEDWMLAAGGTNISRNRTVESGSLKSFH